MDDDRRTMALALEVRARHGVTMDGTCPHCLPPGTPWPCPPITRAERVVERLAAELFPGAAQVNPDWLEGHE